ncbi:hypothetical protein H920_04073 [Fukomys damarensis]|uniref:Uncharacterized protein n=1 Tax=Fukomys damarensis TaxID=885580 RepID=A0A091DQT5_FUKDA|nr:hypothetical protein H920_04073 [Fukomys damarensis]
MLRLLSRQTGVLRHEPLRSGVLPATVLPVLPLPRLWISVASTATDSDSKVVSLLDCEPGAHSGPAGDTASLALVLRDEAGSEALVSEPGGHICQHPNDITAVASSEFLGPWT